jgi:uncharacterized membrane protein
MPAAHELAAVAGIVAFYVAFPFWLGRRIRLLSRSIPLSWLLLVLVPAAYLAFTGYDLSLLQTEMLTMGAWVALVTWAGHRLRKGC